LFSLHHLVRLWTSIVSPLGVFSLRTTELECSAFRWASHHSKLLTWLLVLSLSMWLICGRLSGLGI
jgi:hypothetical protein